MQSSHRFLLCLAMLMPSVCHGQSKCPWINEMTAGGILGGSVTVTANISNRGDGACEFTRQEGGVIRQLRISVDIMTEIAKQFPIYVAICSSKTTALQAVGNEAMMCSSIRGSSIHGKRERYSEIVVGRVRDQAFVVSVSSSAENDPSFTAEMRREKVNLMAEQVAGILF
jgi:hypothetical protein